MKTKLRIYDGALIDVDGVQFKVSITPDEDMDPPWENSDICGPIEMRTARTGEYADYGWKAPSEIFLGQYHRWSVFYQFAEAVRIAKNDGWNCPPWKFRTKGEQAHQSALHIVRYLKGWLAGNWEYVTVTVEPLDEDGDVIPHLSESISGVEYGDDPEMHIYAAAEAESLARHLINSHNGMFSKLPMVSDVIEADEELGDCLPDFDDDLSLISVAA